MQSLFPRAIRLAHKALLALPLLLAPLSAQAGGLIRDAEIEQTLRNYATPVFEKAGLNPSAISIYIINDDALNAFVMGGSNIFVNTGLIMQSPRPEMVIGVLAHETGHISGGHLVRSVQAQEQAQVQAIVGALLGAAAIMSGAGDAGVAIMSGGQNVALRNMIGHTRANEEAADQTALNILDQLGISASGMLQTFEILRKQENLKIGSTSDPYMRTHPLNTDRIMHVRNHVEQSGIPAGTVPQAFVIMHERMLGKLEGFINIPEEVLRKYPDSDTSTRAYLARAVAYFRMAHMDDAVAQMDALIAKAPNDPYFYDLKGQILFENGRIPQAIETYGKAVSLLPSAALIRIEYARALLAREDNSDLPRIIDLLQKAVDTEPGNPPAWRLLATAYGRDGQMGQSYLALAEEAVALNKPELALEQLEYAKPNIAMGTPAYLRSEDLRAKAKDLKKTLEKNK